MSDVKKYGHTLRISEEKLREVRILTVRDELHVTYDVAEKIVDAVDARRRG